MLDPYDDDVDLDIWSMSVIDELLSQFKIEKPIENDHVDKALYELHSALAFFYQTMINLEDDSHGSV